MNKNNDIHSAIDIARYLLKKAEDNGDCITNLKLQKLLYYAQAWYLVNFKERLFREEIQAWSYGSVVKDVYDEFKSFGNKPIILEKEYDFSLSKDQEEYLEEFALEFFKHSTTELVSMMHRESPWMNAFSDGQNTTISVDEMQGFYSKL